jgi:hypothetical protein
MILGLEQTFLTITLALLDAGEKVCTLYSSPRMTGDSNLPDVSEKDGKNELD